jgi:hypothetical protein
MEQTFVAEASPSVGDENETWSDEAVELANGGADDDGSFSSASDVDDLDDVEPKLKYERLGNDLTNIFKKDAASCIAANNKV